MRNFCPVWLSVLALLRKAFASKYNRLLTLAMVAKLVLLKLGFILLHQKKMKCTLFVVQHQLFIFKLSKHMW